MRLVLAEAGERAIDPRLVAVGVGVVTDLDGGLHALIVGDQALAGGATWSAQRWAGA